MSEPRSAPKPAFWSPTYATQFADPSVVAAYPTRPAYPDAVFPLLVELAAGRPRVVLDIGCGTGDIARRLVEHVEWVDAVDMSAPMIAAGRSMPGGDHPRLRWIVGRMEDVALWPPYALVTAGESLQWMDWQVVLPRLRDVLVPGGFVAMIERIGRPAPWSEALTPLLGRFSTNRDYRPYVLADELEQRGLFLRQGERETAPVVVRQSIADYVESFHSRNGFSRDRMRAEQAAAFDRELTALVTPYADGGALVGHVSARVVWGLPVPATA